MPQLVWTALPDGTVDYYNRRAHDYAGIRKIGESWTWRAVLHPEDEEMTAAAWQHAVETGEIYEAEHRVRTRDGTFRWHLSRGVAVRDSAGRIERWYGTATDIHDQITMRDALRRSERELRLLNNQLEHRVARRTVELEARNRELQQFAYVASHDMQEPLRKIQTFASLAKEDFGDQIGDDGNHYLDRMQNAAERMSQLLADLLSFSRVATRQHPFVRTTAAAVMQEVLDDLDLTISQAGATVDVDADVPFHADVSQLRQLLNHLVMNAIKFRREDVSPHVRVYSEGRGDEFVRLVVEDNGIGFDEEHAERIFEPFERLHGRGTYEGTGMGLAICRRIVERHGGTIEARSTPGSGSTFVITLPVKSEPPIEVGRNAVAVPHDTGGSGE